MGSVASAITDVVGDAIESVGDVVSDVGDAVVDNIVEPVVNTVEATIKAAEEDPLGTIVKIAAIATMNPAIIAAANAAVAVAHGADLEEAALVAGKSYVAGLVGAEVTSGLSPEFAEFVKSGDITASQAASLASAAGNVASTTVMGGDPLQALLSSGIGATTASITTEIPGFNEMSRAQQRAVNSAVSNTLQGKDPSQGLINEAIASGVTAAQSYSRAPSDNLIKQTASTQTLQPLPTPTFQPESAPSSNLMEMTMPQENQQELIASAPVPVDFSADLIDFTNKENQDEFYKSIGIDPSSLSAFSSMTDNPLVGMSTRGNYNEITGEFEFDPNGSMENPLTDKSGTNLSSMDGYKTKNGITTTPSGESYDLSYLNRNETDLGALTRSILGSAPKIAYGTGIAMGANALLGEDSKQEGFGDFNYDTGRQSVGYNQKAGSINDGVAYGLDQLGTTFTKEAAQGGIMSLAQGGQIPSLGGYAAGGNPRLLRGPGDGMSDNIPATIAGKQPARLADGEFVVPADVVSHLGNGSTEAGANVLYQMMERVRKARTGNPKQGRQINPQKFVPSKGK